MSINRVCITGNLTRDPEMMATQTGTQILRLGVAVNDRWRNPQTQQWEDRPNYIDCVLFGNRAQAMANILHRGTKVAIEGKLRWSQWQDRDSGKNRSKIEVVIDEIDLMQLSQQQGYQQPQAYQQAPQAYPQPQQAPQRYQAPQAPAQTYAPQQAPQAPPQAQAAPPAPQPQQPQQPAPVYDADIPF